MNARVRGGLLLALMGLAGCYKVSYHTLEAPAALPQDRGVQMHLLWGLVPLDQPVPVARFCPGGVAQVYTGMSPLDWMITLVTVGIFDTRTYEVYCSAENQQAYRLMLGQDGRVVAAERVDRGLYQAELLP